MEQLAKHILNKTNLSLLEFDEMVSIELEEQGCTPTFKGYKGFPAACCMSVNNSLVHGIPWDYQLAEGDLITFDFGATFEGAIADGARTFLFGEGLPEHKLLIEATQKCLEHALQAIRPGEKLGIIGHTIQKTAKELGFDVVTSLGGHSLGYDKPHAYCFVPNASNIDDGFIMQPGLTLAIEPLLVPEGCSIKPVLASDGWTLNMDSICAHEEDTVYLHEDRLEIMTQGKSLLFKDT